MKKSPKAAIKQAVIDLIIRDAEPLVERWARDYLAKHDRVPTEHEIDKAAQRIIHKLTSDQSRYHFTNLAPVWNPDGKTWRLDHVQRRS